MGCVTEKGRKSGMGKGRILGTRMKGTGLKVSYKIANIASASAGRGNCIDGGLQDNKKMGAAMRGWK